MILTLFSVAVSVIWLALVAWYIEAFLGFSNLMLLTPSELGQILLAALAPLILLWLLVGYRRLADRLEALEEQIATLPAITRHERRPAPIPAEPERPVVVPAVQDPPQDTPAPEAPKAEVKVEAQKPAGEAPKVADAAAVAAAPAPQPATPAAAPVASKAPAESGSGSAPSGLSALAVKLTETLCRETLVEKTHALHRQGDQDVFSNLLKGYLSGHEPAELRQRLASAGAEGLVADYTKTYGALKVAAEKGQAGNLTPDALERSAPGRLFKELSRLSDG